MAIRKKPAAKPESAAVAAETQSAVKKPAATRKAPEAKKAEEMKVAVVVEYLGKEWTQEALVEAVKAQCADVAITSLNLYVKPEESAAYYVVNGDISGKIDL